MSGVDRYDGRWFEELFARAREGLMLELRAVLADLEAGKCDYYYRREIGDVRVTTPHGCYYTVVDELQMDIDFGIKPQYWRCRSDVARARAHKGKLLTGGE